MFLHTIFCGLSLYVCFFILFSADCSSIFVYSFYFLRTVILCMFLHAISSGLSFYVCFFILFSADCHFTDFHSTSCHSIGIVVVLQFYYCNCQYTACHYTNYRLIVCRLLTAILFKPVILWGLSL